MQSQDTIELKGVIETQLRDAGFLLEGSFFLRGGLKYRCQSERVHVYRLIHGEWQETWSLPYEDVHLGRFKKSLNS